MENLGKYIRDLNEPIFKVRDSHITGMAYSLENTLLIQIKVTKRLISSTVFFVCFCFCLIMKEKVKIPLSNSRLALTLLTVVFSKDLIPKKKNHPNLHHHNFKLLNGSCFELSTKQVFKNCSYARV